MQRWMRVAVLGAVVAVECQVEDQMCYGHAAKDLDAHFLSVSNVSPS